MKARVFLILFLIVAGLTIALSEIKPGPSARKNGSEADATTFAEAFLAHLRTVQVAADALVELGESRERNLLVVGQGQAAMNAALDSTDAWLAQQMAHEGDPAVVAYRSGADLIRQAMSDAQSAFFRFNWDGIAAANVTLQLGVDEIGAAASHLASHERS